MLFRAGDPGESLFVVIEGKFRVIDDDDGNDLRHLHCGDIIGEISVLREEAHGSSAWSSGVWPNRSRSTNTDRRSTSRTTAGPHATQDAGERARNKTDLSAQRRCSTRCRSMRSGGEPRSQRMALTRYLVVPPLGLEPRTCGLRVRCSAIELEGRLRGGSVRMCTASPQRVDLRPGVTDGTRTRDSQYHKLELYQLSYGHHEGAQSAI